MPKFGNMTNPSIDVIKEIKTVAKMGFDFVEIAIEEPMETSEVLMKNRKEIIGKLNKYNLFALGHAPWWAEFGSPHQAVRKGWIGEGKNIIDTAAELGIRKLTFHLGFRGVKISEEKPKQPALRNYVESIGILRNHAKEVAKPGLTIMLENTADHDIKDFKHVVDSTGVSVNLDVGHAFIHGGMAEIKKYIQTFRKKIQHTHFHDNRGMWDEHLPLGFGKIDFKSVVNELKKIGYDKTITFEVFVPSRSFAKMSMEVLKKLWQNE